jgi:hypothetical protein
MSASQHLKAYYGSLSLLKKEGDLERRLENFMEMVVANVI